MRFNSILALGFAPQLLVARQIPARRDVDCSFDVAPSQGDNCQSFSDTWGITVDHLKELNPGVRCPNLDTSKNYCVIGTASGNNPAPTTTTTTKQTPSPTSSDHSPTMPGAADNCDKFHKVVSGDQCDAIEKKYGINDAQFHKWNTMVNDKCTNLYLSYYVCVHVPGATTTSPGTTKPTSSGPQPQMPGVVSNCKNYYKVQSGDGCYSIEQKYNISFDQIRRWNTEINDTCTNLLAGYYMCVGV